MRMWFNEGNLWLYTLTVMLMQPYFLSACLAYNVVSSNQYLRTIKLFLKQCLIKVTVILPKEIFRSVILPHKMQSRRMKSHRTDYIRIYSQ